MTKFVLILAFVSLAIAAAGAVEMEMSMSNVSAPPHLGAIASGAAIFAATH